MPKIITRTEVANVMASLLIQAEHLHHKCAMSTGEAAITEAKSLAGSIRELHNRYSHPDIADLSEALTDAGTIVSLAKKLAEGSVNDVGQVAGYAGNALNNVEALRIQLQYAYDRHPAKDGWEDRDIMDEEVPF